MILEHKLNPLLKIFLLSLAVVDDLISILVIGVLYSSDINVWCLLISAIILLVLLAMNKNKVDNENVEEFFEYLKKRCITQKTAMTIGLVADCN